MITSIVKRCLVLALVLSALGAAVPSAQAFEFREHPRQHVELRGWHGGRWAHGYHGGHLGWWWVVGPSWYYYPRPYVVAGPPPTVIVQQPAPPPVTVIEQPAPPVAPPPLVAQAPATPTLYWCKATGTYYPETMTCPGGWMTQVGGAPPTP